MTGAISFESLSENLGLLETMMSAVGNGLVNVN